MSTWSMVRRALLATAFVGLAALTGPAWAADPEPVDVNRATVDELLEIPGVGDATAEKIVKGRPYASLDDLAKAGLSEKTIAKIRGHLKVGKAKPAGAPGASGKVDLNKATAEELMALPGVGEATAKKIVDGRPFASVADLAKAGLGAALIEKLTPLVKVGRSRAKPASDKPPAEKPAPEKPAEGGGKVDLNKATAEELTALPGVGEVTAKKIIDGRPYASVADLAKAGLGAALIEKLTPLVTVGKAKGASKPAPAEPAESGDTVDLNEATLDELLELPGVGEVTAAKIVKGRPYSSVEDLERAGLSERLIDKLAPHVTVSAAKGAPAPRTEQAPGGGRGLVWVNTNSGIFHRESSRWYGRTIAGEYMTEAAAVKAGFRESGKPKPDEE